MSIEPAVLDTDTLSELARGHPKITEHARTYLGAFGRLTTTSVTVFERLRGYHLALRDGRPYERQLKAFEVLIANCVVLPFDEEAAAIAGRMWAAASRSQRRELGDLLIAAVAVSRQRPLITRNRADFNELRKACRVDLRLVDWSRS
jgi:toxin FitB